MCKFNNSLFMFTLYCLLGLYWVGVLAKPLPDSTRTDAEDLNALMALVALINSHDVHYDQRQKGEENYRINLDGFFISLPQEESVDMQQLTELLLLSFVDLDSHDDLSDTAKNKPTSETLMSTPLPTTTSSSASASFPLASESNQNISPIAANPDNNLQAMMVEIPASRKYIESRHGGGTGSKTRSYISQLLKLFKRTRKH